MNDRESQKRISKKYQRLLLNSVVMELEEEKDCSSKNNNNL